MRSNRTNDKQSNILPVPIPLTSNIYISLLALVVVVTPLLIVLLVVLAAAVVVVVGDVSWWIVEVRYLPSEPRSASLVPYRTVVTSMISLAFLFGVF